MAFFFFNDTATTEIYTLSLHDALPICKRKQSPAIKCKLDKEFTRDAGSIRCRKSSQAMTLCGPNRSAMSRVYVHSPAPMSNTVLPLKTASGSNQQRR